jgi:hypothetical protein
LLSSHLDLLPEREAERRERLSAMLMKLGHLIQAPSLDKNTVVEYAIQGISFLDHPSYWHASISIYVCFFFLIHASLHLRLIHGVLLPLLANHHMLMMHRFAVRYLLLGSGVAGLEYQAERIECFERALGVPLQTPNKAIGPLLQLMQVPKYAGMPPRLHVAYRRFWLTTTTATRYE